MGRLLQISFSEGSFYGTWQQSQQDLRYILKVLDGDTVISSQEFPREAGGSTVRLYQPEVLCDGKEYNFQLEIVSEETVQSAAVPDFLGRLYHLKENMLSHQREDGSYVLNAEVLESERLYMQMKQFLFLDELIIPDPAEPVVDSDNRTLQVEGDGIKLCFYADENLELQLRGTFLDTGFSLLKDTIYEDIQLQNTYFYFASTDFALPEGFHGDPGLYFLGDMEIPQELNGNSENKNQVRFGGHAEKRDGQFCYEGNSYIPPEDFIVFRNDGTDCRLCHTSVKISRNKSGANIYLSGDLKESEEKSRKVNVSFVPGYGTVDIAFSETESEFCSAADAMAFVEESKNILCLPDHFRENSFFQVLQAGYVWDQPGYGADIRYICIGSNGNPLMLIDGMLEVSDWSLDGKFCTFGDGKNKQKWYSAKLTGIFLLSEEKKVEIGAEISQNAEWNIYLKGKEGSWLSALCSLTGISVSEIGNRLSFIWETAEKFELDEVSAGFLPASQEITKISFCMYQKSPWQLIPSLVELDHVRVSVGCVKNPQWEYEIAVGGMLKIGNGENAAEIFVVTEAAGDDAVLEISTNEKGICLPSFEEILKTFGIENADKWIPDDFWNLDDLRISRLEIRALLKPVSEMQKFVLGVSTEKMYTFSVGTRKLIIKKLEVLLEYDSENDLSFAGTGLFEVFGMQGNIRIAAKIGTKELTLYGEISKDETQTLMFPQLADTFAADESETYDQLPVPADFAIPCIEQIAVFYDTKEDLFAISGFVKTLGRVLFVSINSEDTKGYIFTAVLDDTFTFGEVAHSLQKLDSILTIRKAQFCLSTVDRGHVSQWYQKLPAAMRLPDLNVEEKAFTSGLYVYGSISLTAPLFSNLIRLGDESGCSRMEAYVYMPKEQDEVEIYASLDEFLLLGIFLFKDVEFLWKRKQDTQFQLSGTLSVNVGDSSYDFAGNLCVGNTDGSFSVRTTQSIESFMGIESLVLRELELDLDMVFPPDESETSYTVNLGGRVALGPVDLSGDLLLEGARMRVCRMKLDQALSLDDLFGVIFTEKIWSPGILDIRIYDGSLYYAEENCTLERIDYQKGLHIKAWMSVYGFAFQITGDFQDDSVSVSGNADQPIHLGFLTIAGSESQAGPGISFRTDADSRVLGLTGAIELFGERLLDIKMLGYDFKNRYFSGSVSYNGSVELFHGTISFIWDEKKGIQITEFPMQFIDEMLDYAKLLEEASKSDQSGCEALTGMVFDKIIQTRFDISPSFGEITDGKIVIELLPSYHIIIGGKEIITSSMKKLKIQVAQPESIGFSALAELIIKTVTDNAGSIAGQILADTQGLTKIFAAIGVIKGTQKLFDVLVCRGARETIQGMTDLNQAETCAGIAEKTAAKGSYGNAALAEAAQAAAGAGGSAAGAESSFNAAAAFFSGLMAEFIFTDTGGGNVQDAREHEKEAEKRKTEAKEAEERARQAVRSMLLIKNLTAEEMADRLVIRWDKIPSEGVVLTYHIRIVRNDRVMIDEDTESVVREIELQSEESENFEICVYAEMVYPELEGDYKYTSDVSGISCVTNSALQLDVDKLPEASAGEAYDFQICVSGGIQPLQFSVHGLPAGLILNEDHITGVPKIGGGEVLVDIMVQDGRGRSVKKSFWMKVK